MGGYATPGGGVGPTVCQGGTYAGGVAYTGPAAAGALWVGDDTQGSTRLFRIDLATRHVTRVRAGARPGYVAAAGGSVWVSNVEDGTVSQIDPSTGRTVRTVEVGISPVNLAGISGPKPEVWVPDDAGSAVFRIDARSGDVLGGLKRPGNPAVVSPGPGGVWVSLFEGGAVMRLAGT